MDILLITWWYLYLIIQGSNHVSSNVRFENFSGRQFNKSTGGSTIYPTKEQYINNDDIKHNSYPLMNNQNKTLTKAEQEHILRFNPLNDGLSGSLKGKQFHTNS